MCNGDQEIAALRHGDADSDMARFIRHLQFVGADAAGHVGDTDRLARPQWRKARADQVEIADAIDLIVIGDAAVAITETEFGRT